MHSPRCVRMMKNEKNSASSHLFNTIFPGQSKIKTIPYIHPVLLVALLSCSSADGMVVPMPKQAQRRGRSPDRNAKAARTITAVAAPTDCFNNISRNPVQFKLAHSRTPKVRGLDFDLMTLVSVVSVDLCADLFKLLLDPSVRRSAVVSHAPRHQTSRLSPPRVSPDIFWN